MTSRMSVVLGLVVSVSILTGNAQEQTDEGQNIPDTFNAYLTKSSPDELQVSYEQGDDCSGSYEHIIDSELAQSRIRKSYTLYNELFLTVSISCMDLDTIESFVYIVEVYFGITRFEMEENGMIYESIHYEPDYTIFGIAGKDDEGRMFLTNGIRVQVEKALTDYLKANFDL